MRTTKIDSDDDTDRTEQKDDNKKCERIIKSKKMIFLKDDNSGMRVS